MQVFQTISVAMYSFHGCFILLHYKFNFLFSEIAEWHNLALVHIAVNFAF